MITMKDIAKEVGTSQATVSRVLNGNMAVSPEVRNAVMECVKKHNFQPNLLAKSLSANKSLLIGVIVPDISNPFFADLVLAIETEAMKYGYSAILCNTNGDLQKEKYYISIMTRYKADGIIMIPRNIEDAFFLRLKDSAIPLVISTLLIDGFNSVAVSHYNAGFNVALHLSENGYRKFVFVGNKDDEKDYGFIAGIKDMGYDIETDYMYIDISARGTMNDKLQPLLTNKSMRENCGIFVLNDVGALIVLNALKENGVKIPDEMGLIGFDNTFIGKQVTPSISSVAQPVDEIGKLSVELLIEQMTKSNKTPKKVQLESSIVARAATQK